MLRNLLASGASALVGFGLVGVLPPLSTYQGAQDGEAKTKKAEATATTKVILGAEDTEALLRQAYDRLRRIRAERLEDRQKALVERASELYRQAIQAHEAREAGPARGQALAALELVLAVEQARAAREVARPDSSLPPPPGLPVATVFGVPAVPSVTTVQGVPAAVPVPPVSPLPPLPPPIVATTTNGLKVTTVEGAVERKPLVTRGRLVTHDVKPDGETQVIEIQVDDPTVTVSGEPITIAADSIVAHKAEGPSLILRNEASRGITLSNTPRAKGEPARGAFTVGAAKLQGDAKDQAFTFTFAEQFNHQTTGPAEARAQVQKAYEAVMKAREAKKDGENRALLNDARDLYNSARAAAEASENAKAIALAKAAMSLAGVPNVDAATIQEKTARYLGQAQENARKAQAELEKHRTELEARYKNLKLDQAKRGEALEEQRHALTIARAQQEKALARIVEGKPLRTQAQSSAGPIEVRVATQTTDKDGKTEATLQIHVFKDGKEVPADQVKLEKKEDSYVILYDAKTKEAKKPKEAAKAKDEVKAVAPRVFIVTEDKDKPKPDRALDDSVVGIGVTIHEDDGKLVVEELLDGGPAAKDGRLKQGDRIIGLEVQDGAVVQFPGKPLEAAVDMIRGPEGSKIKLVVQPAGSDERKTYELTRARIVVPAKPEAVQEKDKAPGGELPPEIKD